MTIPNSGQISMSSIAAELGMSASGITLGHPYVRGLARVPTGQISMNALHGKTGTIITAQSYSGIYVGYLRPFSTGSTTKTSLFGYGFQAMYEFQLGGGLDNLVFTLDGTHVSDPFLTLSYSGHTYDVRAVQSKQYDSSSSPASTTWVWAIGAGVLGVGGTFVLSLA